MVMTLRCGGGAAAHLPAQRKTKAQNGDGRSSIHTVRARFRELTLRVSLSPLYRCAAGPSLRAEGQCVHTNGRNEAWEALKVAIADMFRPLWHNLNDLRSLQTVYDLADYQIGMLFGAFLGCAGSYQLWNAAPSICVDVALAYMIYKLSVVSSDCVVCASPTA